MTPTSPLPARPDGTAAPTAAPATNVDLGPVSAVQERLSISRSKAYELLYSGEIESIRLGRRCRRVVLSSIDDYIARQRGLAS